MGHNFAIADYNAYCRVKSFVRSNAFEDADLIDDNVELWLEWNNGPIRPFLGWDAGTALLNKDAGVGAAGRTWEGSAAYVDIDGAYGGSPTGHQVIYPSGNSGTAPWIRTAVDITFDVKVGTVGAGMAWRVQNSNSGFFIWADAGTGRVKADVRIASSSDVTLLTGTTPVSTGNTYTVRFTCANDNWEVFVDGVSQGTFTSAYWNDPGFVKCKWGMVFKDSSSRVSDILGVNTEACPATSYDIVNDDGEVIAAGAFSGYKLAIPDSSLVQGNGRGPYGGYKLRLYGSSVANYGTSKGDCQFVRVKPAVNTFGPKPLPFTALTQYGATGWDVQMRAFFGMGPTRLVDTYTDLHGAAQYLKTNYVAHAHSTRPRHVICAFPAHDNVADAAYFTSIVNANKDVIDAWEPLNEPNFRFNGVDWASKQQIFYNAVKAADPNAIVLGPNAVSYNYTMDYFHDGFYASGGASYITGESVHGYNCTNGDLALARRTLDRHLARPERAGKLQWQTEQSFHSQFGSLCLPHHALAWLAVQLLVQETRGLTIERNVVWYDNLMGFYFSSLWQTPAGITSVPVMVRNMVDELGPRTFASEYALGDMADFYLAAKWTGVDGTARVALMAQSPDLPPLRFTLTGASSVVTVDAWGNEATVNRDGSNIVSFDLDNLPLWVRLPSGVSMTIVAEWTFGTNLALGATVSSSAATMYNAATLVDGVLENQYEQGGGYPFEGTRQNFSTFSGTVEGTNTYPITLNIVLAAPTTATLMVLSCMPPWATYQGVPTDFDAAILTASGTWKTFYSNTPKSSVTYPFVSDVASNNSTYDTWFNPQTVWLVPLTGESFRYLRLVVRASSWAGHETQADSAALWGAAWNPVTPRDVRLYNVAGEELAHPAIRYLYTYGA